MSCLAGSALPAATFARNPKFCPTPTGTAIYSSSCLCTMLPKPGSATALHHYCL